jgi:hypothetical protein
MALEPAELGPDTPNALMISLEGNRLQAELYGISGGLGPELPGVTPLPYAPAERAHSAGSSVPNDVTAESNLPQYVAEPALGKAGRVIGSVLRRVLFAENRHLTGYRG